MPDEIDEIMRKRYGNIYAGNVTDMEKLVKEYMEKYDKFIFKSPQADIESITGEYVYKTIKDQKETAGGLDHWRLASLKFFTRKHVARLQTR